MTTTPRLGAPTGAPLVLLSSLVLYSLVLSSPAAAFQGYCDQGPVLCTTGNAIALAPETATTVANEFPVDASVFLNRYDGDATLVAARIEIELSREGRVDYTNLGTDPCPFVNWNHTTELSVGLPSSPLLCSDLPASLNLIETGIFTDVAPGDTVEALLPVDGACAICADEPTLVVGPVTDPVRLAALMGDGQLQFRMTGALVGSVNGCVPGNGALSATAELRVTIRYYVCPMSAYCFGVGCPCGNDDPSAGCANGAMGQGAYLSGIGTPSVLEDSTQLTVVNSEPGQPGLFFQGVNATGGGNGVTFGDGLRCASGSVVRLEVASASPTGTAITTVGIADRGNVSPGERLRYQWWYRDAATPACGNSFNLSNGVEMVWFP